MRYRLFGSESDATNGLQQLVYRINSIYFHLNGKSLLFYYVY